MTSINMILNTGGERGEQGPPGQRGEQGPRGLQGPRGAAGAQGIQGPMGRGITVLGSFESSSELPTSGEPGDSYLIGVNLWTYSGTAFVNMGPVRGPQGLQGPRGPEGEQGPAWILWRGLWAAQTSYQIGDGVMYIHPTTHITMTLRATQNHVSGTEFSLSPWEVILQSQPGPQGPQGPRGLTGEGEQGPQGPQGIQGPVGPPGTLANTWRGIWEIGQSYSVGDVVRFIHNNGAEINNYTLLCMDDHDSSLENIPNPDNLLTNWTIIAVLRDGVDGRDGADGTNINVISFTNEVDYDNYTPGINELVVLIDG